MITPDQAAILRALPAEKKREAIALLEEKARRDEARRVERDREECKHLPTFIRRAWSVIEPGRDYTPGWHIDAICDHLAAVTQGDFNRLLINVPPGTMKSLAVGVFWPAWEWGPLNLQHKRTLATAHNLRLATRDNIKARRLIQSEWFQARWPIQLMKDQNSTLKFENAAMGFRDAMPFGSLTGSRGDSVVVDDPLSVDAAASPAERAAAKMTFLEALPSRLNDPISSAIVVIMQRLHEEDISGIIIDNDLGYEHLMLPMEFEADRRCRTAIGFADPRTQDGELLFPERFPREVVERDKKVMGPYAYAGQYQQRPSPRNDGFFIRSWFQRYRDRPAHLRIYGTSDYAVTAEGGDYTVHRVWGVAPSGDIYLLGGWRGQATTDVWIDQLLNLVAEFKPLCWFGEGGVIQKAIEPALKRRMLERRVLCRMEWLPSIHDKPTRARGFQARAAAGTVYIPEGVEGDAVIDELVRFPTAKHDDEVDAASLLGRALDTAHPAIAPTAPAAPTAPKDRYFREPEPETQAGFYG